MREAEERRQQDTHYCLLELRVAKWQVRCVVGWGGGYDGWVVHVVAVSQNVRPSVTYGDIPLKPIYWYCSAYFVSFLDEAEMSVPLVYKAWRHCGEPGQRRRFGMFTVVSCMGEGRMWLPLNLRGVREVNKHHVILYSHGDFRSHQGVVKLTSPNHKVFTTTNGPNLNRPRHEQ